MHRERLTHLLANAILELWKKETGSLSSVIIEGTICITSSTGKTTVLQVADRFTGSIPEACEDELGHSFSPPEPSGGRYNHHNVMRSLSMPPCYNDNTAPPRVDCQNQAAMAAFLDNLSPASLVSPGAEHSRSSHERKSPSSSHPVSRDVNSRNSNNNPDYQNMDVSSGSVKEEMSESGSDTMNDDKNISGSGEAPTGGICPGTGYYTCTTASNPTQEMNNNTIDPKHALKFHKGRPSQSSPDCNNKRRRSCERSPPPTSDGMASSTKRTSLDAPKSPLASPSFEHSRESTMMFHGSSDAMDLTRKGVDDLALSPPHSYTAQVRDIIRQRVLAAQMKSGSDGEIVERLKDVENNQRSPQPGKPTTPKVLESLGLHRSGEERGEEEERSRHSLDHSLEEVHHRGKESALEKVVTSSPGELRVAVGGMPGGLRRHSHASHPMLPAPISPIVSSSGMVMVGGAAPMLSSHSPLPSPSGSISSSSSGSSTGNSSSNGPLHNILTQHAHPHHPHHRLYLPLTPLQRPPHTMGHSGPSSAPPVFTHPGFSPLTLPQTPNSNPNHRDASPSPTDLSLDSSGESEKELGPNGEQRVYRCEFCTKTFLFKSKYHEHLPVHTNARPFQCHLCSRTYKYKYDLRVHLRTHMGIPTKSTVCPFCNTKFDTNKRLRVHIKDAHKDKQKVSEDDCTQTQDNLPPAL